MWSIRFKLFYILTLLQTVAFVQAEVLSYSTELKQTLASALKLQAEDYRPHTQYMCEDTAPCYTNRLILESSPYLLQHAHNPIDWYSWGEEAFTKARRENKAVFLSIGYAACHWCKVMEKESFDNLEIARYINKNFISIKVDRERRPDIDELYGHAVMYFKSQQGWPMSLFLTPDGSPFYGGGYYTKSEFKALLLSMADYWMNRQQDAIQQANKVIDSLKTRSQAALKVSMLEDKTRKRAIKDLLSIVDAYNGGFGEGSKFPREPWLLLLLDDSYGEKSSHDSSVALHTALRHMAEGGIYDQLGGGFHRYTTDPYWKIPHFEKMLYNQALLIRIYLRANAIQPNPLYVRVAQQSLDYLLMEMSDPQGAFYAAMAADTEGKEGRYYLWNINEWQQSLSKEDSEFSAQIFDVDKYGEIEETSNVLYIYTSVKEYAQQHKLSVHKLQQRLDKIRQHLKQIRSKRVAPEKDKKIIMGWNGLVITALAESSKYLDNKKYLNKAAQAADFIWNKMRQENYFYRTNFQGKNSQPAQLEDYAFYLQALIALYDVDKNNNWLVRAKTVADMMLSQFWDDLQGGFFNISLTDSVSLPFRPKSAFDKTLPSGNAVAAHMLIRLARRTGDDNYQYKADALITAFTSAVQETPSAFSSVLVALNELHLGEKDLPVYAARGLIRVDAVVVPANDSAYELRVDIEMENNWHINAHRPLDKQLIPTSIKLKDKAGWRIEKTIYPQHDVVKLGYSRQPLALYHGRIQLKSKIKKISPGFSPEVILQLQACNDRICLAPEELILYPSLLAQP
jgi:hypothetical protein